MFQLLALVWTPGAGSGLGDADNFLGSARGNNARGGV